MSYLMIGAGQAGGAIVDSLFKYKYMNLIADPILINSTAKDLHNIKNIPDRNNWYGISETHGLISGKTQGFEEKVVGGFGKNPVRSNDVLEMHYQSILDMFDDRFKLKKPKQKKSKGSEYQGTETQEIEEKTDIPFALLFLGLGGGTGCGISSHIARALKEYTNNKVNIIAVGVLPTIRRNVVKSTDQTEDDASDRQAWNANYGIMRLKDFVDGFIIVDNQRIAFESNMESMYLSYNDYIATCIADLISGLFLERIDPKQYPELNPPVIDMNDILTALSFDHKGRGREVGFASIGRASSITCDLLNYIIPLNKNKKIDTLMLARLAAKKQSISNINLNECEKNLALIRAPPHYLKKSSIRINTRGIEEFMVKNSRLNECHLGVSLTKRNLVSLTTLFTFEKEQIPRLNEMTHLAQSYEEKSKNLASIEA